MMQIELTEAQIAQMKPLFDQLSALLRDGTPGAILAQPYRPGYLSVTLITREQGEAIQKITGLSAETVAEGQRQLDIRRRQLLAYALEDSHP